MALPDEQFLDASSYRRADLESPFLDGEFFVADTEADWEPRVERLQAESPFQRAFDKGVPIVTEERTSKEEDYAPDDEFFLSEAESDALRTLAPSELKAVRITSTFETGRPGSFGGLTGNFDGQGVSFGLMNYAWKAGSLVTLLKDFLRDHPAAFGEVFGPDAARFRDMLLATKPDPKNPARQVRDVDRQMDFARHVLNDANNTIREPWRTYFQRLENSPAFQRIQVKAVRRAAERARYWCDYFGLRTERAFAFMFDLVTSHGGAWLNAPKFKGRRRGVLRAMLEQKQAAVGRADLTELEKLEVIANMIADVSLPRWRQNVRVRKLWFVRGLGEVHGKFWDLTRDFGVTDSPPDFGAKPGLNEFEEEFERYGWDENGEAGDPEREWEDQQADRLRLQESLDYVAEAPSQEAFDEEALADLAESSKELYGEEPEEEEESFFDDVTCAEEAPFEPEEAGIESEAEFEDLDEEAAYVHEGAGLDEESFIEPEYELDLEQEIDPTQGQTLYLPIELNKTIPPNVGVFIPSGFRPAPDLDVIVYFHGHIIPRCQTYTREFNEEGIKYYWNTPLFKCLREDLVKSGRNAILIAPTFIPIFATKDNHPRDYGELNHPGKFDFLIDAALTQLKKRGALPEDAQVRRIVLSGHSGGGLPMKGILDTQNALKHKIAECWGFECLYGRTSAWEKWLSANPGCHFRHYRRPAEFNGPTKTLQKFANFIDINNATDHCRVVDEKWRQAIDSSSVFRDPVAGGAPTSSPTSGGLSTLFSRLAGLPGLASLPLAFMTALLQGFRDENQLTNLVFLARHPELGGRKLTRSDPQFLKDEWLSIQRTIVRPALRRLREASVRPGALPTAPVTTPPAPRVSSPRDEEFTLTEWPLAPGKIVVAHAGDKKKGTAVEITEAPAVFLPQILRDARGSAAKDKNDLAEKLDPAVWFKRFTRINFLGRPLKEGQYLHVEMAKMLQSIEREMVRQYGGDAKSVGDVLLNNSKEGIVGSRRVSSTATFSMHMFGLAVDVNYKGNPYIQRGDINALNTVLKNAAGLMNKPPLSYRRPKGDTAAVFDIVRQLDAVVESYFRLLDQPAELARLVQASSSPEWRSLSPMQAKAKIQKNLDDLAGLLERKDGELKEYFKQHGILDFDKRFVVQMEALGMHWGARYGDMMHFDMRRTGVGSYVENARLAYKKKVEDLAVRLVKERKYGTHSPA